jgi:vitamin B12 transporter
MRIIRNTAGLVLASAVLAAPASSAQEPSDTARLEPVVVTATRLPTPLAAVTASVTVLDGATLRARGIRGVSEALRDVPGLSVVQQGSYGGLTSVFVRGGESDYVKVLIDGAPANQPGGAFDFATLSTDNVERIEIVRGPASVLYGSDAVSGVVQIFTHGGSGSPAADAQVRGGTYGSFDVYAALRGGTGKLSYSAAVARAGTDGIHQFNSDADQLVLSGLVQLDPDERTDARLAVRYSDNEFHFPTDGSGQVVDRNAFQQRDRFTASLDGGRFLGSAVEARVLLAYNRDDGGIDDRPDDPADSLGFFGFVSEALVQRASADARVNLYSVPATVLTVGGQYEHESEDGTSESLSEFGSSVSEFAATRNNVGFYGQAQATPVRGLALTLGGRLDDNQQFGTFFTYRAGVTYGLGRGTSVRGAVGSAFKEPTFFENFADNPFARGNPNLSPERTSTWEVGLEQLLWRERLTLGVTYFDQRFRDLIQYTAMPPAPDEPNYFNVAAADASGLELEARLAPAAGLTVGGSYTYLHTEIVDAGFDAGGGSFQAGQRLLRRPTHSVNLDAAWRFAGRAYTALAVRYVGDRDDRDFTAFPAATVVLPAYWRLDLAGEVDLLRHAGGRRALTATLRVENLLDEQYQEVFGFAAPGRRVLVGGRVRF